MYIENPLCEVYSCFGTNSGENANAAYRGVGTFQDIHFKQKLPKMSHQWAGHQSNLIVILLSPSGTFRSILFILQN